MCGVMFSETREVIAVKGIVDFFHFEPANQRPDVCRVPHIRASMAHDLFCRNQTPNHSPPTPGSFENALNNVGIPLTLTVPQSLGDKRSHSGKV